MPPVPHRPSAAVHARALRWPLPAALAVGFALALSGCGKPAQADAKGPGQAGGGARGGGGPVPVVTAKAQQGDLPVVLTGLGTVTPFSTVTVRARVDGQLIKVAFAEGQQVSAGDVLAELDERPYAAQLKQAQGQLARDQAQLRNAQLDLVRYKGGGTIFTQQQIDTQAAAVDQLAGTIATDQGLVDNAQLQLGFCRVVAPVAGRIGLRLVDAGNMIHAADATGLAVITTLQPIAVVFTIRQDDLPQVLARQGAGADGGRGLAAEAWGRDLQQRLTTGALTAIDNQIDPGTGTVRLKATFANADNALFPNQFVNIRLLVDTLKGVVLVPNAAIQRAPDKMYVYLVGEDQKVAMREVTVGVNEGGLTQVDGIHAGDTVVTDGVDKLKDGAAVTTRAGGAGGHRHKGKDGGDGQGDAAGAGDKAGGDAEGAPKDGGKPARSDAAPGAQGGTDAAPHQPHRKDGDAGAAGKGKGAPAAGGAP
jgi:multidrug efflux system membrane fusion protein